MAGVRAEGGADDVRCAVDGCERSDRITRGWCHKHYERWRRTGEAGGPGDARASDFTMCSVDGCDRTDHGGRGWCNKHYQRWKSHGDPEYLERPTYGEGRRVRSDGYIDIWDPEHPLAAAYGYVAEHRKVAWDAGLLTDPANHVHHKNHDKTDNRLENLEVLTPGEHGGRHVPTAGPPIENAKKTHCVHGHELSPENIYESQLPHRVCKLCARRRAREAYHR